MSTEGPRPSIYENISTGTIEGRGVFSLCLNVLFVTESPPLEKRVETGVGLETQGDK